MISDFSNKNAAMAQRPKTLVCYICGREFGTQSLNIHIKSCIKKWENEQAKLPKKERRPLPKPPQGYDEMVIKGQKGELNIEDVVELNKEAFKQYDQVSLIKCEYCNRTFLPERMDGHRKLCTAEKPFKPLGVDKSKNLDSPQPTSNKVSTPQKQPNQLMPAKAQAPRSKSPAQSPAQSQKMPTTSNAQQEEEKISPKKSNFGSQQKQEQHQGSDGNNYKEKYEQLAKNYEVLKIEFEAMKRENELLKKKMKA